MIWLRRGILCMQVFRVSSLVSYTIEQDQMEPTMFVFFKKFNAMILVALCAKRNESGSHN